MTRIRFSLPVFLLALLAACHEGVPGRGIGAECSASNDCREPFVCDYGRCRSACRSDAECVDGACVASLVDPAASVCTIKVEQGCKKGGCPAGLVCGVDDQCRSGCDDKHPCNNKQVCVQSTCIDQETPAGGNGGTGGTGEGGAGAGVGGEGGKAEAGNSGAGGTANGGSSDAGNGGVGGTSEGGAAGTQTDSPSQATLTAPLNNSTTEYPLPLLVEGSASDADGLQKVTLDVTWPLGGGLAGEAKIPICDQNCTGSLQAISIQFDPTPHGILAGTPLTLAVFVRDAKDNVSAPLATTLVTWKEPGGQGGGGQGGTGQGGAGAGGNTGGTGASGASGEGGIGGEAGAAGEAGASGQGSVGGQGGTNEGGTGGSSGSGGAGQGGASGSAGCPDNSGSIKLSNPAVQYLATADDSLSLSVTTDFTLEAWVKPATSLADKKGRIIASKYGADNNQRAYYLSIERDDGFLGSGSFLRFYASPATSSGTNYVAAGTPFAFSPGIWIHVAVVFSAQKGTAAFYRDGILVEEKTGMPPALFDSTARFMVGGLDVADQEGNSWDGGIDEVRVWSIARTGQQIQDSMSVQLDSQPGLRGYWPLDANLLDVSGNDNDLSAINGATLITDSSPATANCVGAGGAAGNGGEGGNGGSGGTEVGCWKPILTTGIAPNTIAGGSAWLVDKAIFWGGVTSSQSVNTGGLLDPVSNSWSLTTTTGAPSARLYFANLALSSQFFVWGGSESSGKYSNNGSIYDPSQDSWTPLPTTGALSDRAGMFSATIGGKAFLWGGKKNNSRFGDGVLYDPGQNKWLPVASNGAPSARGLVSAGTASTGSEVLIWGGEAYPSYPTQGALYNPITDSWRPMSSQGVPEGRDSFVAIWTGEEVIIWGGYNETIDVYPPAGAMYNPVADTWTPISTSGAPEGRRSVGAVWTGSRMLVWGGTSKTTEALGDGFAYDPKTDTWSELPALDAPSPRYAPNVVWTGKGMAVWNGSSSTNQPVADGAVFYPNCGDAPPDP